MTEVRPTSFDMAVRIRVEQSPTAPVMNGRCTITIERGVRGVALPIPREVRDEFVAIQLDARARF